MRRLILPRHINKPESLVEAVRNSGSGEPITGSVCSSVTPCSTPGMPPVLEPPASAKYDIASAVVKPQVLTPNQCRSVIIDAHIAGMKRAKIIRNGISIYNLARTCDSCWLERDDKNRWLYELVEKSTHEVNEANFGFDLREVQTLQVLRYRPMQYFSWHLDVFPDSFRKVTAVFNLSNPQEYRGGGFRIDGDQVYNRQYMRDIGSGLWFPSFIRHCARAPWWGERWVLVAWFLGPRLR